MTATSVSAIYENGTLRLLEPVELAEGQEVRVNISVPAQAEAALPQHERIRAILQDWEAHPDDTPEEWWDEFIAFLKENRFDLPERDLGFDDL